MPPPNVTGTLHLGHALALAVQDALVRSARTDGADTLFVPGTDHAGLGMYAVVRRNPGFCPDLPPPARLQAWADHHRALIVGQLHELGLACDWDEELHTLAPGYRALVERGFAELAAADLLYRQYRVMPWCPECRSTVPDVEQTSEVERVALALLTVRLAGRPQVFELAAVEEVWGAVAVAVPHGHPAAGSTVRLPADPERELPVLGARVDTPRLVVPALRQQDLELATDHGLAGVEVLDAEGRSLIPELPGLTREEVRRSTIGRWRLRSLTRNVTVVRCGLCATELTARRSRQWYLRLAPLVAPVRAALDSGELRIGPAAVRREAAHWMDSARDWCVSRQIRWGQPIPAVICDECPYWSLPSAAPDGCPKCGGELRPETDVLDTWFNSAHWPVAVGGWPDDDRAAGAYPVTIMTSGRDILFFWFVRLLAVGTFLTGRLPTRECWLHGLVLDEHGRKMSKSRGNVVTLADALRRHGSDVLRSALLSACRDAEDVRVRNELFARQAAVREPAVALARLATRDPLPPGPAPSPDALEHHCRRAALATRAAVRGQLGARHFDRAVGELARFAGQVLERYVATRVRTPGGAARITGELLTEVAAAFEPFMPEAARELRAAAGTRPARTWQVDERRATAAAAVLAAAAEAERLRGVAGLPPGAAVIVDADDEAVRALLAAEWFAGISEVNLVAGAAPPQDAFPVYVPDRPAVRLWLPADVGGRLRHDVRRRLRKTAQRRRRLTNRLGQLQHSRASGDHAARAERSRDRLGSRLARAQETTARLRDMMTAAGAGNAPETADGARGTGS